MTAQTTAIGRQPTSGPPSIQDGGAELFAWFQKMRDEHPVWRDQRGICHVFRYADVQRVLSDFETFSSNHSRFVPSGDDFSRGNLTAMDPPQHRKLRRLVSQAFTPRIVASLAPRITEITAQLLDDLSCDEFDLIERFARPLPVIVIAELLGVPVADRDLFRTWVDGLLAIEATEMARADVGRAVAEAMRALHEYMLACCRQRRSRPREDLISQLVGAEVDGERLDDQEVARLCTLLLLAGHITTTMLLGNMVLCLHENPAATAELRADRTLIPGALDEVLRYRSSFMQTGRFATAATRIGAVTVPRGGYVTGWLLSANHDERQFADADRFDIHRKPTKHVAFGHGIHFCLGALLARLEGKIALELLLDRFAAVRLTPGADLVFYDDHTTFGLRRMRVTVDRDGPLSQDPAQ